MVAWANVFLMVVNISFSLYYYCKSAGPAALERKMGEGAYIRCTRYRKISSIFMVIYILQYGIYFFYPLTLAIPERFPWPWWISAVIALVIALPAGLLLGQGAKYAGKETFAPAKKQKLFRGIYRKIRHPQAVGELPFFWVISFLLHSPFLALFSVIALPVFHMMCRAEERDLEIRYRDRYIRYKQNTGMFFPRRSKS
jgi:protein-S-isoprenylcysteine O-methyltransferase Ste14